MLLRLSIVNYALISRLDIGFGRNFSVITGETGAGKSIILGAISLMLGQRADNISFPDPGAKCTIEGTFDLSHCDLEAFFQENDLDYDVNCIIRREVSPQGKSRAFINDTPVNLNQLRELTSRLIDVHSQHQTLLLQESSFQLSVLDSVAGNASLLQEYRKLYKEVTTLRKELAEVEARDAKAQAEADYLNFISDELSKASLKPDEQELLENEAESLTHSEEIKTRLYSAVNALSQGEENILRSLNEVNSSLQQAARYRREIAELQERVAACVIELRDLDAAIQQHLEAVVYNPQRLGEINDRLNLIYHLQHKHRAKTVEELLKTFEDIDNRIAAIEHLGQEKIRLAGLINQKSADLLKLAQALSESRSKVIRETEITLLETISMLGMPNARFEVKHSLSVEPGHDGIDRIQFLFSANKGVAIAELSKIASGGELSRLMLAVKSLISGAALLPTIIFDEIDTGISGETATKVGTILTWIASRMQVIAITHLPQIAGRSDQHFKVFKFEDGLRTWSAIEQLNPDQRIAELANMISGDADSPAARNAAKELLLNKP